MPKNISLYLDALRLLAAVAVFLAHDGGLIRHIPYMGINGPEAVACFFVLSGFVITFVGNHAEATLTEYAVARIARIYPVAVLAMLVTFIADRIGLLSAPQNYLGQSYFDKDYVLMVFSI
jgi:peptidoglycan/LPS O-acetylase OafA/YrhL